jgi:hypothetical protein
MAAGLVHGFRITGITGITRDDRQKGAPRIRRATSTARLRRGCVPWSGSNQ